MNSCIVSARLTQDINLFRLNEAEEVGDLPMIRGYLGLALAADDKGCFRWLPEQLKITALPYDDLDFADVLDVLLSVGLVDYYRVGREWYGFIPDYAEYFGSSEKSIFQIPAPSLAESVKEEDFSKYQNNQRVAKKP